MGEHDTGNLPPNAFQRVILERLENICERSERMEKSQDTLADGQRDLAKGQRELEGALRDLVRQHGESTRELMAKDHAIEVGCIERDEALAKRLFRDLASLRNDRSAAAEAKTDPLVEEKKDLLKAKAKFWIAAATIATGLAASAFGIGRLTSGESHAAETPSKISAHTKE